MKVVIYSKTALAAAPWELYKALKKYTLHDVTLINETTRYRDGRIFPQHLLWVSNNGTAKKALADADLWHIHNYLPAQIVQFKAHQQVLAQFHSIPRLGNWKLLMKYADISYTIAQPLQEKEYKINGLPNIIDPDEYMPARRPKKIKIAFAPTTRTAPSSPDSKGYLAVRHTLDRIASKRHVDIEWIEGVPYEENLDRKRKAHIIIDDIVTGNWHRTTLEAACFGCAVLNRVQKVPFVFANIRTLEEKLLWLIDTPAVLKDFQERMRLWVLQEWHAIDRIKEYTTAYRRLIN